MPLPKDVHFLVPEAVMYYFTWQRDFEDVIKLRILRLEVYPGLSGWVKIWGGKQKEIWRGHVADLVNGGKDQEPRM